MTISNCLDDEQAERIRDYVEQTIASVRAHLKMEAGFVSEFCGGRHIFQFVHCESDILLRRGDSYQLPESDREGVVGESVPSAGAHVSVPIILKDGVIYGTFCCFSRHACEMPGDAQLDLVRVCANLIARMINAATLRDGPDPVAKHRIEDVISTRLISMVYQPIYRLADNRLVNYEALARFPHPTARSPDLWFAEAASVGLGPDLERLAVEEALKALLVLPGQASLSVNLSPEAFLSDKVDALLDAYPCDRLIVELTEHAPVSDYKMLRSRLAAHRQNGLRLAIDDVGAGHANFRHILELGPDLIKLDTTLTRNIDADVARQTLAESVALFGRKMGCEVVAEGVETYGELAVLRMIGATKVQGYLLGRPVDLNEACRLPHTLDLAADANEMHADLTSDDGRQYA